MRNFSNVKRIVIKIGTNTLAKDCGVDTEYIAHIASQINELHKAGKHVLIVTSGAIGMGSVS
jgi:glutamate 5-kinase